MTAYLSFRLHRSPVHYINKVSICMTPHEGSGDEASRVLTGIEHEERHVTQHFCGRPFDLISNATQQKAFWGFLCTDCFQHGLNFNLIKYAASEIVHNWFKSNIWSIKFLLLSHNMIFDAHSPMHKHTAFYF